MGPVAEQRRQPPPSADVEEQEAHRAAGDRIAEGEGPAANPIDLVAELGSTLPVQLVDDYADDDPCGWYEERDDDERVHQRQVCDFRHAVRDDSGFRRTGC